MGMRHIARVQFLTSTEHNGDDLLSLRRISVGVRYYLASCRAGGVGKAPRRWRATDSIWCVLLSRDSAIRSLRNPHLSGKLWICGCEELEDLRPLELARTVEGEGPHSTLQKKDGVRQSMIRTGKGFARSCVPLLHIARVRVLSRKWRNVFALSWVLSNLRTRRLFRTRQRSKTCEHFSLRLLRVSQT